ncbi:MAG: hypothetical protein JSV11_01400 [Nitrospiraceae bacterium]|jgi:hypothetical protein|nr:MAG: hypothetical protein JSU99_08960 [Nitrospiraceae bacterium]UCH45385.1 MAG: hypothetical protein JSV11_01400 [Nitrospiraceae bacterium]
MNRDIWIFLFFFGLILFNWPILSIFKSTVAHYLFLAWFLFIALIFVAANYKKKKNDEG